MLSFVFFFEIYIGNDFNGISIKSSGIIDRAKEQNYPFSVEDKVYVLQSPEGYKFYVIDEPSNGDPVEAVIINSNDLEKTQSYWSDFLNMKLLQQSDKEIRLSYSSNQAQLVFKKIGNLICFKYKIRAKAILFVFIPLDEAIDRKTAFGRIAFAIPFDDQTKLNDEATKRNVKIIHPLTSLDTPGKATVRVIILSDPNDLEICYVDEEGFTQLSQVDERSDGKLTSLIKQDPFQKK